MIRATTHQKIIDLGWDELVLQNLRLANAHVKIGLIHGEENAESSRSGEGQGVPTYSMEELIDHAIALEYGIHGRNLPSRPFMAKAFDGHEEELGLLLDILRGSMNGSLEKAEWVLTKIGEKIQEWIKQSIVEGEWEPNSPHTVKKVAYMGDKPLVDSGQLLDNIKYKVVI